METVMEAEEEETVLLLLQSGLQENVDDGAYAQVHVRVSEEREPTGHCGNLPRHICDFVLENGAVVRRASSSPPPIDPDESPVDDR